MFLINKTIISHLLINVKYNKQIHRKNKYRLSNKFDLTIISTSVNI